MPNSGHSAGQGDKEDRLDADTFLLYTLEYFTFSGQEWKVFPTTHDKFV